ncbi:MAG: hypothetical protein K6F93_04550 [Lachnospiraceae bacterium]|nr:hypothetical protein [Lachnospiraceae bacterium]
MLKFLKTDLFKYGFMAVLYIVAFAIAGVLLRGDFWQFFGWWWTLIAAGVIFMPVGILLFGKFNDCGILFCSTLGVAVMSWLSWLFASIGFIPFTTWGCVIILILCTMINIAVIISVKKIRGSFLPERFDLKSKIIPMLISGFIFLVVFLIWTYIRGFKPEALGDTESIMDYAFMKSMDRANYMPAEDMWMAGKSFNYYYLGQYIATFLSKLSGVGVGYGYNLMLMTEAGLAFALPYSLVMNVFSDWCESKGVIRKSASHAAGLISGIAVSLCGNFHYIIFNYLVPPLRDMLGVTDMAANTGYTLPTYFFPNSTRYIGYVPNTSDKTIHEFPSYSFILGDLHAHVINIMFVLCVMGILYAYIQKNKNRIMLTAVRNSPAADKNSRHTLFGIEHFFKKVFDPCVVFTAFFIGMFHMTNYWDYPIYFVVAGAVILYVNFSSEGARSTGLLLTLFHAAIVVIISKLVCLPFTLSFDQISSEILAVTSRTPLYQFLILWGFPFLVGIVYVVSVLRRSLARKEEKNVFFRCLLKTDMRDVFIVIVVLCAMGLCLIPEFIYVKDIYSGDYKRANTMFKITYQAFILFGISFGYIIAKMLIFGKKSIRVFGVVCLCLVFVCAGYTKVGTQMWYFVGDREYTGICSTDFLEEENAEYEAIRFLDENVKGRPVIIEANGDSYSRECRFSAWTGLPTLLGWKTHEWLWRSSGDTGYPVVLSERENDIRTLYTSEELSEKRKVIDKYDISYIIIGNVERLKYAEALNEDKILELGEIFFENEEVTIIKTER